MPEKYLYFFSNPILSTYIFFWFSFNLSFAEIGNWLGQLLSLVVFTTCHITTELINHRNKEFFLNCRNLKRNFVYYGQFCLLASLKVSQSNRDCTHQLNDFHLDSVLTWSFTHKSFCLICFRHFSAHDSEQWYTARQSTEMFPKAQMRENSVISGFKGTSHYLTSLPQTKNIATALWLFMVNAMLSQAHEVTVTSRWDWVRASHKVLESSPKVSVLLAELSKHRAAEKGISLKPALLGHGSDQQPKDAISFRMIHSEIQSRCGKLDLWLIF